jgi:amino acid transporter
MDRIYRWIHTFFDYISSNAVLSSWGSVVKFLIVLCLLIVITLVISYVVMQATQIMVDITQKLIYLVVTITLISLILWAILWLFNRGNLTKIEEYFCKGCQTSSMSNPIRQNPAKGYYGIIPNNLGKAKEIKGI